MEKPYHIQGLEILGTSSTDDILKMLNERHWHLRIEQKDTHWQLIDGEQIVFVSDSWDMIFIFLCGMGLGHLPVNLVDDTLEFRDKTND
ncbi:MAG: hypothetical protein SH821_07135 [Phototrophicales bacterium]|nr:hypothetical protein [Phototrophicales bacterium]